MLLIDHNVGLILDVCDRIHVLDQGRTLAAGRLRRSASTSTSDRLPGRRGRGRGPMPDGAPVLEVEGLEVRYGRVPAVRGLTRGRGGRVVGLVGPNGAGKSSTLHAIMGVVPPPGRRAARRPLARRQADRADRPRRRRARPRGPPHLRRLHRGREPAPRPDRPPVPRRLGRRARARLRSSSRSSGVPPPAGGRPLRRPAAAARDRPGPGREPDVLLLDEPSLGLAPASWTPSSTRSPRSARAA